MLLGLLSCQSDPIRWEMPNHTLRGWWDGFATQGTDDAVLALAVHDSVLVAGGYFQHAGPVAAACVAAWDGTAWRALGAGMSRADCPGVHCDAWVAALVEFQGGLVAGGRFTAAGGGPAANIARWNGSGWSPLGEGLNGTVRALCVHEGELFAAGEFTRSGADSIVQHIARWDGAGWRPLGGGTDGPVYSLCSTATGLVAGGAFMHAGTDSVNYVARWDADGWGHLGTGLAGPAYAIIASADSANQGLYACARARSWSTPRSLLFCQHSRETWGTYSWDVYADYSITSNPCALGYYGNDLVVGGDVSYSDSYRNGVTRVHNGSMSAMQGGLWGQVTAFCEYEGHLYVGGRFEMAGNLPSLHLARWDD
jgi:trimeric autotransporter adhesin